jgi:ComF family protein
MAGVHAIISWQGLFGHAAGTAIDALAPPHCLACQDRIQEAASLCSACWRKLSFIEAPCCDRLGVPFAYDQGEGAISPAAAADPPAWDRARAATAFNETSRDLVHSLKYRDRHEVAQLMSRLMYRAALPLLAGAEAVVPVPLHRRRLWFRRYNQSALLAQKIAGLAGLRYWPELLVRSRATRQQVGLDHEERQRNVRRAFTVPEAMKGEVGGLSILLVDDVLTTGATASAASTALKKAGAAQVDVVTFALVIEPKRLHI